MPRRRLQGTVVSDKMDKTAVVRVETIKPHPLYHKVVRHHARFKAHDEDNAAKVGDVVIIEECRPLSREKSWRIVQWLSGGAGS
jgi:small subunit ribosomal protein S17